MKNCTRIKTKQLPELDDEFAKDVDDEVETLAELKEKTKHKLEHDKKHRRRKLHQTLLIGKAVEGEKSTFLKQMISNEVDRMMNEFSQHIQSQGLNLELYCNFRSQDEEALKAQMKEEAEGQVRTSLTLEAIAEVEKLEATDEKS